MHRTRRLAALLLATTIAASCSGSAATPTPSTSSDASATTSTSAVAETAAAESDATATSTADLGAVGTLESGAVHEIAVVFDDAAYDTMLAAYLSTGEKQWIEATVTIDGETFERVGLRLKGNSSLKGVSADADPTSLPWLIALDKFVDGQSLDGLTDLVVRSNSSTTALNEAVALELLSMAGLASQDAIATSFSVNGGAAVLRLTIENPNDAWMAEEFTDAGALYKAEASGDYSYRGDDATAYEEAFDQEAGKDTTDLTPLVEFLDFVNNADDATFAAELADRLDVDAFATYLAMEELLDNFDDIDGPGNNSYLYYDAETQQFTVVPWDHNLAFGLSPNGGGAGGQRGGGAPPAGGGGAGGDGPMSRSNVLVERFLAVDGWQQLYATKLTELRASLFDGGTAQSVLDTWTAVVSSSGLVDDSTITNEASQIAAQLS